MKYTERGSSETRRYTIQHVMLSSSGDVKMDVWARNEKLFPWAAVAALLEVSLIKSYRRFLDSCILWFGSFLIFTRAQMLPKRSMGGCSPS